MCALSPRLETLNTTDVFLLWRLAGNKDLYNVICEVCKLTIKKKTFFIPHERVSSIKYAFNITEVLRWVFKSPKLNCKTFKLWDFNAAYLLSWEALWTCTHLGIPRLSSLFIIYSARMRPAFVTVTVYHSILAKIVWYSIGTVLLHCW